MCGQAVTWLVPHAAGQVLPTDVDYKIMLTFLELYHTLIKVRSRCYRLVHGGTACMQVVLSSGMGVILQRWRERGRAGWRCRFAVQPAGAGACAVPL